MLNHIQNKTSFKPDEFPVPAITGDFRNEHLHGFIQHPQQFPLQLRILRFGERKKTLKTEESCNIGLIILSEKYLRPGTVLEISIPMRKDTHKFTCKVVLIQEEKRGYGIGLWLMHKPDEQRIRIVEQVCHIEHYLGEKRRKDGPFLSQEKIMEEWITKFAARFPAP